MNVFTRINRRIVFITGMFSGSCLGLLAIWMFLIASPNTIAQETKAQETKAQETGVKPPLVSIMRAKTQNFIHKLSVTGALIAREEAQIKPEIEGLRLTDILVSEGDHVAPGQVLAKLSREDLQTQLAQADAALMRSEANIAQAQSQIALAQAAVDQTAPALERAESLKATGNLAQAGYDQRLAEARTARAQLNNAQHGLAVTMAEHTSLIAQKNSVMLKLGHAEIKTPVAGIVATRNARLGAIASMAGEALFTIITNGDIEMDALVPEAELTFVRAGQKASVSLANGQNIAGSVRLIMPDVDSATRLGHVRLALEHSDLLHPGSFVRGTIELERRNGLAVPRTAILFENNESVVQLVDGKGLISLRPVITGIINHAMIEVQNGLQEGDRVVAKAGPFLTEGDSVRVLEDKSAALAEVN